MSDWKSLSVSIISYLLVLKWASFKTGVKCALDGYVHDIEAKAAWPLKKKVSILTGWWRHENKEKHASSAELGFERTVQSINLYHIYKDACKHTSSYVHHIRREKKRLSGECSPEHAGKYYINDVSGNGIGWAIFVIFMTWTWIHN